MKLKIRMLQVMEKELDQRNKGWTYE